jgi:hypothetical protein
MTACMAYQARVFGHGLAWDLSAHLIPEDRDKLRWLSRQMTTESHILVAISYICVRSSTAASRGLPVCGSQPYDRVRGGGGKCADPDTHDRA